MSAVIGLEPKMIICSNYIKREKNAIHNTCRYKETILVLAWGYAFFPCQLFVIYFGIQRVSVGSRSMTLTKIPEKIDLTQREFFKVIFLDPRSKSEKLKAQKQKKTKNEKRKKKNVLGAVSAWRKFGFRSDRRYPLS